MASNRVQSAGTVLWEVQAPSTASIHEDKTPDAADKDRVDSKEEADIGDSDDLPNLVGGSTYIVDWEGPDDPENPRKYVDCSLPLRVPTLITFNSWTFGKKWAATTMVSAYVFMSPVSSSMMAPASKRIAAHFNVTNPTLIALQTSMFLGGYGALSTSALNLLQVSLTQSLYSCRATGIGPTQRSIWSSTNPSVGQFLVPW